MLTLLAWLLISVLGAVMNMLILRWYVLRGKDGTCPICRTHYGPWTKPFGDDGEKW